MSTQTRKISIPRPADLWEFCLLGNVPNPLKKRKGSGAMAERKRAIQLKFYVADEQWAKIHNLKQAAKTFNFLTEHDISEYEQL